MGGIAADDTAATWLCAVATIAEPKQLTRTRDRSTWSEPRHEAEHHQALAGRPSFLMPMRTGPPGRACS